MDAKTPGYRRGREFEKMGWHGSPTGELSFDDCVIPADAVLGEPTGGRAILMAGLNSERIVMAAEAVGIAQGALDVSLNYAPPARAVRAADLRFPAYPAEAG